MGCMPAFVSLLFVCVLASLLGSAYAQCNVQLYVSQLTGNDGNPGTQAAPFLTISAAWSTGNLCSNGTIWVDSGLYTETTASYAIPANIAAIPGSTVAVNLSNGLQVTTAVWNGVTFSASLPINSSIILFQNCKFTSSITINSSIAVFQLCKFTSALVTVDSNITIMDTSFIGVSGSGTLSTTRGTLNVIRSNFTLNQCTSSLANCVISGLTTVCGGSSIRAMSPLAVTITGSLFNSNALRAAAIGTSGGAVAILDTPTTQTLIENCIFTNNSVTLGAIGALQSSNSIFIMLSGRVTVRNCTFLSNVGGEAIVSIYGSLIASASSLAIVDLFNIKNFSVSPFALTNSNFLLSNSMFMTGTVPIAKLITITSSTATTSNFTIVNSSFENITTTYLTTYVTAPQIFTIDGSTFKNIVVSKNLFQLDAIRTPVISNSIVTKSTATAGASLITSPSVANSVTTLYNCTFSFLVLLSGSGPVFIVPSVKGHATISKCTFSNNANFGTITGSGSILISTSGSCTIQDSIFENNIAVYGGAAITVNGREEWNIVNSVFRNNSAIYGSVYYTTLLPTPSNGLVTGSIFDSNFASSDGGAMNLGAPNMTIDNCTFTGNSASNGGGAISFTLVGQTVIQLNNSYFANNTDSSITLGGGAVYFNYGTQLTFSTSVNIYNTTFLACTSTNAGGALYSPIGFSNNIIAINIEESTFIHNSAVNGGAVYLSTYIQATIEKSHFSDNYASSAGAAINVNNAQISVANTLIENNICAFDGGGMWISISSEDVEFNITNCIFSSNRAIIGNGGALYLSTANSANVLNSNFINNTAISASGGAIFITMQTVSKVIDCTFINNSAFQGGATVVDLYAVPTFIASNFSRNLAISNGGAILSQSESMPTFIDCIFNSNEGQNGGAIAVTGSSEPTIQQSVFINNYANENGGGIYAATGAVGYPIIEDTEFIQNSGTNGGGLCCSSTTSMTCYNCSFTQNMGSVSGGAIYMDSSCKLLIVKANLQQNRAVSGGGVYCDSLNYLNVSTSKIYSNKATTGGAIQWGKAVSSTGIAGALPFEMTTTPTNTASIIIETSEFVNNSATLGGALDMNFYSFNIQGSSFVNNHASYGGGLYFITKMTGIFTLNNFTANDASYAGGGYFWDTLNAEISRPNCAACIFQNNSADYSPNYATGPSLLLLNVSQNATIISDSRVGPITLAVVDGYLNTVSSSSITPSVEISLQNNGQLYGTTIFYSTRGIIDIASIGINGYFNSNYTLIFSMKSVPNISLSVFYYGCSVGQEGYSIDSSQNSYKSCRNCAAGYYNLNGDNICYPCPAHAQCSGDTQIAADTNYWLLVDANGFASTYDCPAGFCGNGGECTEHRSGTLCGHCEEGYQNSDGSCIECKKTDPGSLFSNLLLLWIFITALQLVSKAPEGKSTESVVSGLTKIVVFFVQTIPFVMTPAYKIRKLFSFFNFQLFFNVASKCSFKADFYQNFLIYNFLPAILFAFLMVNLLIHFIVHLIAQCLQHRWEKTLRVDKSWYIRTMTSLLSFSYTTITQNVILYLNCRDVGDYRVVASNPDVSCRTDKYHHYSALAYILLALYVLAFPIALAIFLYWAKLKKWFDQENFSTYAGLLYQPFRPQYYFWEVVILVRRLIVIGIYVLAYSTTSARNLGLFCFSLLMLSIHIVTKPFASASENHVETALLILLTLLAGAGSSYADQQFADEISVFTSVIVFMAVIPVGIAVYQLCMALLIRYHIIRPASTSAGTTKTFLSSSRQDLLPHETPTSPSSTETTRSSSPTHKHVW